MKQQTEIKLDIKKLKLGDKLSRLSYLTVLAIRSDALLVSNEAGMTWDIGNSIVERECYSASQFTAEKAVTRSELIDIFNTTGDGVYTVCFNKQPKLSDAFDSIANKGKIKSNATLKKELAAAMEGEERILVGYTVSREVSWGRSLVVDLEVTEQNRLRQVDHRTINWLIFKNTKYSVK